MSKFLTFDEWYDLEDRYAQWEFIGGGTDHEYEEWVEDEYDRYVQKINQRAGEKS